MAAPAAAAREPRREIIEAGDVSFTVRYWPEDAEAARQVRRALRDAPRAAERWEKLSAAVTITIHPSHEALEDAVHRKGYPWLRAWARYDSIDMQSPRTWSHGPASDVQVAQLVTHELAHCAMFQAIGRDAPVREIPLWFREGMASVAAGEHDAHSVAAFLAREYAGYPHVDGRGDPLSDAPALVRADAARVYWTADGAFRFLVGTYGDESITELLDALRRRVEFRTAFQRVIGVSVDGFVTSFRDHALAQATRG